MRLTTIGASPSPDELRNHRYTFSPFFRQEPSKHQRSSNSCLYQLELQKDFQHIPCHTFFSRKDHVVENLGALDFELSVEDLQLISGLATLAEPLPPGDGFVSWPFENSVSLFEWPEKRWTHRLVKTCHLT